jgi:hypothetical protein
MNFKTKRAADQFANYLRSNPLYVENIQKKEAHWRAVELREMREKAARVAAETPAYDSGGGYCGKASYALGIGAIVVGVASSPAGFWVGILGTSVGTADVFNAC